MAWPFAERRDELVLANDGVCGRIEAMKRRPGIYQWPNEKPQ